MHISNLSVFLKHLIISALFLIGFTVSGFTQLGNINGLVSTPNGSIQFATIQLDGTTYGAISNHQGNFELPNIPYGAYNLTASYIGYKDVTQAIEISAKQSDVDLDIQFTSTAMDLDEIVVSGTKTFKRKTDSPIIVNVLNSTTLDKLQVCNLAEGLKFQPGLRVEVDCQTCNYTQLRMNGLAGGYAQILINGRPIFSPLTGLYGLEQLPVNMIDRIEVVRGGGSSLYGSSAIAGTVNVLTKIPKENNYSISYNHQSINGNASDHQILGNATLVSENKNSGVSFFMNHRLRSWYDHNDDDFSELPLLKNTSFGANAFFLPTENQKIELSISQLNEYRYGGEMIEAPAFLAAQAEERTTNVSMISADYQITFNQNKSSLITYFAWQGTDRTHYTGILPDDADEITVHHANPPYGNSDVNTLNTGLQFNHRLSDFLLGSNIMTLGLEYLYDDVYDSIESYEYLVDQTSKDLGLFVQSDWALSPSITLLSGLRMDNHNFIDKIILSPRASLLYKHKDLFQFRLNYGAGFRAPQAFDADLHIAFAGGGISRVNLDPDLQPEDSHSYSASINFDKPTEDFVAGFTLEGFHTRLNNAFILDPVGEDGLGELFIKRNGQGATVQGATIELRANYNRKAQIESGFTFQSSLFDEAVDYIDEVEGIREFIRTPSTYGFVNLSYTPNTTFHANLNYVYTGVMFVPHFAGAANQSIDEIITTQPFHEINLKCSYFVDLQKLGNRVEFFAGVKNIFNAYQDDFDIGKDRDSNFIYGPAQPRTFFLGLKFMNP